MKWLTCNYFVASLLSNVVKTNYKTDERNCAKGKRVWRAVVVRLRPKFCAFTRATFCSVVKLVKFLPRSKVILETISAIAITTSNNENLESRLLFIHFLNNRLSPLTQSSSSICSPLSLLWFPWRFEITAENNAADGENQTHDVSKVHGKGL